ncbi:phenylalanyl-tRNA synthetase beta chain [Buchnera aphidicola str. Bp (Baizongia pistaciae)]|uniref:Phenylalanine--tRNA ligase beta subunit n=1 Tax=Buchnera aphidicola subsp. Baizongia pistaciae (strain Bp) TaxID=224915 RepID=SYFB_BUCBP|nr:phenylalanine--tRNA ligase subunit beta [Buchnera aphidicola]P59505.1 RecName: Full=Phenylalanine--tRNA ligase beta subunit; AltName: Full=Phenylalanyl-tRNA synthetase beta subunit; Short=PheRS [Buchnera aphidicola str. Bp (Baizongia pistaciae)]AAO26858.1 phenylalanyl-tRNA synthetase beta chain [Buchnera aphidicola str. Bp (Baizongia pistaciae)]
MEFSEKWLLDWLGFSISNVFYEQMTKSGIEVEAIAKISKNFERVIVGEVVERLYVNTMHNIVFLRVKLSEKKMIFSISSNDIEFSRGTKIAIATQDSKLFNNRLISMLRFKEKISEGMVCSFKDLGILNIKNKIVEICSEVPVGTDISKFLWFDDDRIIKVSSAPNRADGMSILGIARDMSALNNLCLPTLKEYHINITNHEKFRILINIPDVCLNFIGRTIQSVNLNRQTPLWILERLRRSSISSENVLVDIINYVLIELGQPIFSFNIHGIVQNIIIRTARDNEQFFDSCSQRVPIDKRTILLSDDKEILVLGNHTNSYNSRLSLSSHNIFLGCALFNPEYINNDSHFNFGFKNKITEYYSRGVDSDIQYKALNYVTYLVLKICGGNASNVVLANSSRVTVIQKKIFVLKKTLHRYVNNIISDTLVVKYLLQLGYLVEKQKHCWLVIPPSWRFDIQIQEDVISDLVRVFGYHNIPACALVTNYKLVHDDNIYTSLNRIKLLLVDLGYNEVITYSFVDSQIQKYLFPKRKQFFLLNPISRKMSSMRLSLWNGLLSSVLYNQNRQEKVMRFFESGLCFEEDGNEYLGVKQDLYLAGVISGYKNETDWRSFNKIVSFYDLKGDIELIMALLRKLDKVSFKKMLFQNLCPKQSAAIYFEREMIGVIGVISSNISKKMGLKYKTIVFELIWKKIAQSNDYRIRDVSLYPRCSRDISIIVNDSIAADEILKVSKNVFLDKIVEVKLFDVFYGKNVGLNKKSLSLRFIFGSSKRTLSEEIISNCLNECIRILQEKFNAILRDRNFLF